MHLRLACLVGDEKILRCARKDAFGLVERGPGLRSPECCAPAEELRVHHADLFRAPAG